MRSDCDLIVVGGGPAGTATGIRSACSGLRVILLESQEFPRDRPGETLHPGVAPILAGLGIERAVNAARFLRHTGHWVGWGSSLRFVPFGADKTGPWRGYQAWRAEFDQILLERARAVGVKILQPCRAQGLLVEDGRVVGVHSAGGDLRSRYVVDASGGIHWAQHKLDLGLKRVSQRLIAHYGYCEGQLQSRQRLPIIRSEGAGWVWISQVKPNLYQWTRLTPEAHALEVKDLPTILSGMRPKGGVRGADVTWRIVPKAAGPGFFVAGDAASVVDPAASHGVLKALMSGIMVAHCIAQVISGKKTESLVTEGFRQWASAWFERDTHNLSEFYDNCQITLHRVSQHT